MSAQHEVAIVGSGFAGLGMGVRLRALGITDFVILEEAAGLGGTWRDNVYPGAACDVPSHLYSFSFEPNPRWTRKFAPQAEILAYLQHVADAYGVSAHVRANSRVRAAEWDERRGVWSLSLGRGEVVDAKVLVAATGALSQPAEPTIQGLSEFQGAMFHTARWNSDCDVTGKTVAVIGTGASAIQVVPAIAPRVASLKLFQRTPPWILPKADRPFAEFEQRLFARWPRLQRALRRAMFWQFDARSLAFVVEPELMALPRLAALLHLRRQVQDAGLRAKLTPNYQLGCKRVLLSDDYYPALQRGNVELVTTPIASIQANSIATDDGCERVIDAIVLATGFRVGDLAAPPFEVRANGRSLTEAWQAGPEAYLGTAVAGFPNLFFIAGPNSLLGHSSMVDMIEGHIQYIASGLEWMRDRRLASVRVKPQVQARFNRWVQDRMQGTIWAKGGCRNRYQTSAGKHVAIWPGSAAYFRGRTARFDPDNYDVTPYPTSSSKERDEWHVHP